MPRRNRTHYQHAMYHVMLRGNNRQLIFIDEQDKRNFLQLMARATIRFNCMIHLYCLMDNHIHAVIEVDHIPLTKIVQSISSTYANKFNLKHNRVGHLFQGRYRAEVIYDDHYLKELCFYIHMNPAKAGIVENIDYYDWSSHNAYRQRETIPWLTTNHVMKLLSNDFIDADPYTSFINTRNDANDEPHYCTLTESKELSIKRPTSAKIKLTENLALENISLQKLAAIIFEYFDIPISRLHSPARTHNLTSARAVFTYFAHYHAKHTLKDIGIFLGKHPDGLSKNLQRYRFNQDSQFCKAIKILQSKMSVSDTDILL